MVTGSGGDNQPFKPFFDILFGTIADCQRRTKFFLRRHVHRLAERLRDDGLRVWLDDWEIRPGDLIGLKIEQGLEQSRTLVLALSADAFASEWVTLERHTALFRDPTNARRRFIPLRLDDAKIKDTLRQFAYVDWRDPSDEHYAKLLAACRPPAAMPEIEQKVESFPNRVLLVGEGGAVDTPIRLDAVEFGDGRQARHFEHVLRDHLCLTTLLGANSRVRAWRIDQADYR